MLRDEKPLQWVGVVVRLKGLSVSGVVNGGDWDAEFSNMGPIRVLYGMSRPW